MSDAEALQTADVDSALARMRAAAERLGPLNRALANGDFDRALEDIGSALPGMQVHAFPTGSEVFDWRVPERWELRGARVRDEQGRVVLDAAENPLHVVSYSLPKHGRVSREELFAHLHSDPSRPDAIPYHYAFYERDWGLCCSERQRSALEGETFEVELDTEFVDGDMHVGELVLEGERPDSLLFMGHLDHPSQVNDGLLGALTLVELARILRERGPGTLTYRFLFVPERIGGIAWVHRFQELLPHLIGGVFLDMPAVAGQGLSLQLTRWGDTKVDRLLRHLIGPDAPVLPCWKHVVNDDGFFNSPGVDIPVTGLSRSAPGSPFAHFPAYHSDMDIADNVDWDAAAETLEVLERFCAIADADRVPVARYVGEPFLSKHGLWIDWRIEPELNAVMEDIYHGIDGRNSVFDIAEGVGRPYDEVRAFIDRMQAAGLVEYEPATRWYSRVNPWESVASRELPPGARQAGS